MVSESLKTQLGKLRNQLDVSVPTPKNKSHVPEKDLEEKRFKSEIQSTFPKVYFKYKQKNSDFTAQHNSLNLKSLSIRWNLHTRKWYFRENLKNEQEGDTLKQATSHYFQSIFESFKHEIKSILCNAEFNYTQKDLHLQAEAKILKSTSSIYINYNVRTGIWSVTHNNRIIGKGNCFTLAYLLYEEQIRINFEKSIYKFFPHTGFIIDKDCFCLTAKSLELTLIRWEYSTDIWSIAQDNKIVGRGSSLKEAGDSYFQYFTDWFKLKVINFFPSIKFHYKDFDEGLNNMELRAETYSTDKIRILVRWDTETRKWYISDKDLYQVGEGLSLEAAFDCYIDRILELLKLRVVSIFPSIHFKYKRRKFKLTAMSSSSEPSNILITLNTSTQEWCVSLSNNLGLTKYFLEEALHSAIQKTLDSICELSDVKIRLKLKKSLNYSDGNIIVQTPESSLGGYLSICWISSTNKWSVFPNNNASEHGKPLNEIVYDLVRYCLKSSEELDRCLRKDYFQKEFRGDGKTTCLMCDRSPVPGTGFCNYHSEHESD